MLRIAFKISEFTSKIVGIPLSKGFLIIEFGLRFFLLGWNNVNDRLSRVSKENVIFVLRLFGATIGKDNDIDSGIRFHNAKGYRNFTVGNNCHIGKDCFFDLRDRITIEDHVVISMQCTFITHIDMSKSELSKIYKSAQAEIIIADNVYIGVNSTILKGVKIAKNALVGARTLVNDSISYGDVVVGTPAKVIKKHTK